MSARYSYNGYLYFISIKTALIYNTGTLWDSLAYHIGREGDNTSTNGPALPGLREPGL